MISFKLDSILKSYKLYSKAGKSSVKTTILDLEEELTEYLSYKDGSLKISTHDFSEIIPPNIIIPNDELRYIVLENIIDIYLYTSYNTTCTLDTFIEELECIEYCLVDDIIKTIGLDIPQLSRDLISSSKIIITRLEDIRNSREILFMGWCRGVPFQGAFFIV